MSRGGVGSVYLSRRQPHVVDPECSGTIECALIGVADHILIAGWLLLMIVVAIGSLLFLPKARDLCDRERQRTRAEYDAFDRFIAQVRELNPSGGEIGTSVGGGTLLQKSSMGSTGSLQELRTAYENTVMAVPHFGEEYGETVAQHMREELGDEIAEAVATESTLSLPLQRTVLDASTAARERRGHFLEMLNEEADSLNQHEQDLRSIAGDVESATSPLVADQSFDMLRERHANLEMHQEQIQGIVAARQDDRNAGRTGAMRTGKSLDLQAYLYQPMEPSYPVLAEATELLSKVSITLRRVEDELIYRG